MIFSDKHKILTKHYISWRDIMRDSRRQNFWTKDGQQVALTGCSRNSETHVLSGQTSGQRQTAKCPHGRKHWPDERYGSESRGPARTHSTVREISLKTGIPESSIVHIIRKDLQLKCFKRQRAQQLTEANCTARKLLLKKFFPVCRGLHLLYRWKDVHCGCSSEIIVKISWFHRIKANKIKNGDFKNTV